MLRGRPRLHCLAASLESGIGKRSGSGCCTFAKLSADRTTCRKLSSSNLLVNARAVRPPNTARTETHVILFGHILMNRIVRKPRQRKPTTREKHLDLIPRREFPDAIENIAGMFLSQHEMIRASLCLSDSVVS